MAAVNKFRFRQFTAFSITAGTAITVTNCNGAVWTTTQDITTTFEDGRNKPAFGYETRMEEYLEFTMNVADSALISLARAQTEITALSLTGTCIDVAGTTTLALGTGAKAKLSLAGTVAFNPNEAGQITFRITPYGGSTNELFTFSAATA